jgi:hypothetical protein
LPEEFEEDGGFAMLCELSLYDVSPDAGLGAVLESGKSFVAKYVEAFGDALAGLREQEPEEF